MSEEDRMDRARRIRRMREGRRAGDERGEAEGAEAEPAADSQNDGSDEAEDGEMEGAETTVTDEGDGEDADETVGVDDAVAEALERVSGASAPVPGPEEMSDSGAVEPGSIRAGEPAAETDDAAGGDGGPQPATDDEDSGSTADEFETARQAADAPSGLVGTVGRAAPETRVLEFTLDDEQYCLDIEYVEEIVKDEQITRVPNTPEYVEGVVDLRGQITTIINPKVVIEKDDSEPGELLLVLDGEVFEDQGHLGWVVDDVRKVAPVTDEEVTDAPGDDDHVNGIIDREDDDEFVVWTTPDLVLDEAT